MRLSHSTDDKRGFANWLLDIGHGTNMDSNGTVPFNIDMCVPDCDTLINNIYPNIDKIVPPPSYFLDRIILAAQNSDVDNLNTAILQRFPEQQSTFYSADAIETQPNIYTDSHHVPVEYLRLITASGLPPGELHLKTGCPLILLRNLAPARGLCNGTRLILCRATGRVLEVKIIGSKHHSEISFIPRIGLIPSMEIGLSFQLRRCQFSVRLVFVLTINKAQEQSVRFIGVNLREPIFSHGQLYVALSRATSHKHINILLPSTNPTNWLYNVVYPEIFQMI